MQGLIAHMKLQRESSVLQVELQLVYHISEELKLSSFSHGLHIFKVYVLEKLPEEAKEMLIQFFEK